MQKLFLIHPLDHHYLARNYKNFSFKIQSSKNVCLILDNKNLLKKQNHFFAKF